MKSDGTNNDQGSTLGPVNNWMRLLFSQVDVSLNARDAVQQYLRPSSLHRTLLSNRAEALDESNEDALMACCQTCG